MAQSKKMNEAAFAKIVKELDSVGEFILTKQNEKQSVMDDFDKEKARLKSGKISEATLMSSARKVNSELMKLDDGIRNAIAKVGAIAVKSKEFAAKQRPKPFRAKVSGIYILGASKKKASPKKKPVAKKPVAKKKVVAKPSKTQLGKELVLDKKFSK